MYKRSAHYHFNIFEYTPQHTHTRKQYGGDGGGDGADLRPLYGTFRHAYMADEHTHTQRAFILIEYICRSSSHSSFKMMAFM